MIARIVVAHIPAGTDKRYAQSMSLLIIMGHLTMMIPITDTYLIALRIIMDDSSTRKTFIAFPDFPAIFIIMNDDSAGFSDAFQIHNIASYR